MIKFSVKQHPILLFGWTKASWLKENFMTGKSRKHFAFTIMQHFEYDWIRSTGIIILPSCLSWVLLILYNSTLQPLLIRKFGQSKHAKTIHAFIGTFLHTIQVTSSSSAFRSASFMRYLQKKLSPLKTLLWSWNQLRVVVQSTEVKSIHISYKRFLPSLSCLMTTYSDRFICHQQAGLSLFLSFAAAANCRKHSYVTINHTERIRPDDLHCEYDMTYVLNFALSCWRLLMMQKLVSVRIASMIARLLKDIDSTIHKYSF